MTADPIAVFVEETLGDRPGVDRPYRRGDTVVDAEGREWTFVLDHSPCFCGPHLRWMHHEPHPSGNPYGGHNTYRDDLPEGARSVPFPTDWASIGDVAVVRGNPPDGNPYRSPAGQQVTGQERAMALEAFRDGVMIGDTTFWYAPSGGGARLINHPHEIDWRGMRS